MNALDSRSPAPAQPAPGVSGPAAADTTVASTEHRTRVALALLIGATVLFALGPALLKSLMNIASGIGLGTSGLSYCNVLFVGNFCAGAVTLLVGRPGRILREIAVLPRRAKTDLVLGAIVSTIHPALLYTALERTSVINIVLLSRFNGIVYVLAAWLLLRAAVSRSEVFGYSIIGAGVIVLLLFNNMGHVGTGDGLVLLATVFFTMTELISKRVLRHTSIQAYVFFRNFVSALIFFGIGMRVFGLEHFAEAFSGDLWVLMVLYAGIAIVAAQAAWLKAVQVLPVKAVANSQLLNPLFSIVFAYLLLGEVPTYSQSLVIGLVFVGMLIPRLSRQHRAMGRVTAMNIDTSLVAR